MDVLYLTWPLSPQDSEKSETEKLLHVSKKDTGLEGGPEEDEEDGLLVADYESDEEAIQINKCVLVCVSRSMFMYIYGFW